MTANPWSKFFWNDWESDPALRLCSLAAQGLWMRLLCVAAKCEPFGYVLVNGYPLGETDVARLASTSESEAGILLAELERNGVFSRDRKGRMFCRRMVRDAQRSATNRKNGKKGGNPSLGKQRENSQSVNPPDKPPDKPHKPEANSQNRSSSLRSEDLIIREFDDCFWPLYPRKVSKGAALKAFRAARKRAELPAILSGLRRYAGERAGEDPTFTKHPASWLNSDCWNDEPKPKPHERQQSPPRHVRGDMASYARNLLAGINGNTSMDDTGHRGDDAVVEYLAAPRRHG